MPISVCDVFFLVKFFRDILAAVARTTLTCEFNNHSAGSSGFLLRPRPGLVDC